MVSSLFCRRAGSYLLAMRFLFSRFLFSPEPWNLSDRPFGQAGGDAARVFELTRRAVAARAIQRIIVFKSMLREPHLVVERGEAQLQ
jgi:hypothetical protein